MASHTSMHLETYVDRALCKSQHNEIIGKNVEELMKKVFVGIFRVTLKSLTQIQISWQTTG